MSQAVSTEVDPSNFNRELLAVDALTLACSVTIGSLIEITVALFRSASSLATPVGTVAQT